MLFLRGRKFCLAKYYSSMQSFMSVKQFSNDLSQLPQFIKKALKYGQKTAIVDQHGEYSYQKLAKLSNKLAKKIGPAHGERIAVLTPNDASYVVSQWAAYLCGGIFVPLCKSHPPSEIDYVLKDAKPKIVISSSKYSGMMKDLATENDAVHVTITEDCMNQDFNQGTIDDIKVQGSPHEDALIIYTSGTTGRPKGVLWTHKNLNKQIDSMMTSWKWHYDDTILHILPLHHIHGVVNALMCPLSIGGTVVMKDKFKPDKVWNLLLGKVENSPNISVFMAVPTIYVKLLQYFDENLREKAEEVKSQCERIRLMVSGSASLPIPVFNKWKEVTSHDLLERYGMTEIGMALTNPYRGRRIPGAVGWPFPGVKVKIISEQHEEYGESRSIPPDTEGELYIQGPIFKEYWGNPQATKKEFIGGGWFKTGDTARYEGENGPFRIVGRTSVDVIKSGGFKIGALEVERHLLEHENISEVAILGVSDKVWGQRVGAIIVLRNNKVKFTLDILKSWSKDRMMPYQIPSLLKIVEEIPKNAMGKVNKKQLVHLFKEYSI